VKIVTFSEVRTVVCSSIKGFVAHKCRFFFTHLEKYFSYSEKLVVPNLWPSVYMYAINPDLNENEKEMS
jgi:hypothetical protein